MTVKEKVQTVSFSNLRLSPRAGRDAVSEGGWCNLTKSVQPSNPENCVGNALLVQEDAPRREAFSAGLRCRAGFPMLISGRCLNSIELLAGRLRRTVQC
jgi:hypothetical protein